MKKVRSLHNPLIIAFFLLALLGVGVNSALAGDGARRIIGGSPVETGEWPATAAIVNTGQDAYFGQFGGGALIHPVWVVTAAQNVVIDADGTVLDPEDIEVVLGNADLLADGGERIAVKTIMVHPNFDVRGKGFDVALLELAAPSAQPVAPIYFGDADLAGETATALGWGIADYDSFPSVLQSVEIPVVSDETGAAAYLDRIIPDTVMFAGAADGGMGACDFDTGGPLLVKENGALVLAGVFSWTEGCGDPGKYGAFTRISDVRAFLETNAPDIQETAWLPLVGVGGGWDTEITITNTGDATLTGQLRPRDVDGKAVPGHKNVSLEAGESVTFLLSADFTNPGEIHHISLHTNGTPMNASARFTFLGIYSATVPAASKLDNTDLYIPIIQSDGQRWTAVSMVNTSAMTKTLKVVFDTGAETDLVVGPGAQQAFTVRSLFDAPPADATSAVIQDAEGVVGLQLVSGFDALGAPYLAGAVLKSQADTTGTEFQLLAPR